MSTDRPTGATAVARTARGSLTEHITVQMSADMREGLRALCDGFAAQGITLPEAAAVRLCIDRALPQLLKSSGDEAAKL